MVWLDRFTQKSRKRQIVVIWILGGSSWRISVHLLWYDYSYSIHSLLIRLFTERDWGTKFVMISNFLSIALNHSVQYLWVLDSYLHKASRTCFLLIAYPEKSREICCKEVRFSRIERNVDNSAPFFNLWMFEADFPPSYHLIDIFCIFVCDPRSKTRCLKALLASNSLLEFDSNIKNSFTYLFEISNRPLVIFWSYGSRALVHLTLRCSYQVWEYWPIVYFLIGLIFLTGGFIFISCFEKLSSVIGLRSGIVSI